MKSSLVCVLMFTLGLAYHASALDNYVAEIFFLIEPQVVRNYMEFGYSESQAKTEIKGDLRYFVFEANKLYESLANYDLNLELRTVDVKFADHEIYSTDEIKANNTLNADIGLNNFKAWLTKNDAQNTYNYDVAIILTGYDITSGSGSNQVAGYATLEAACVKGSNAGIVEFTGAMNTVVTLAHELGHSLGSEHDGSDNDCESSDGYIMASTSSARSLNRWSFSSCSQNYIAKYIKSLNDDDSNCLKTTTASPSTFSLKEEKGRDILNRDKVCERERHNSESFFCHSESMYGQEVRGDIVCQILWCGTQDSSACWTGMPSEGMVCDIGKRCVKGKCVTAPVDFPTPSNLNPACLWNDTKTTHLYSNFNGGCKDYISQKGARGCYNSVFQHRCCYTCGEHYTGIEGCEYGDRSSLCKKYKPKSICYGTQIDMCCETCKDYAKR